MARSARFVIPDLPHHVTQRGNRREAIFFEGALETLDRFGLVLAAERKGLVMDREEVIRTGIVGHADGLLWRAMGAEPRFVGADGHDGQFVGPARMERAELTDLPPLAAAA